MLELSEEERQQALNAFEAKQRMMYEAGKLIVFIIATVNIISAIVYAFIQFNLIGTLVTVIVSFALYRGVSWVRYLYVAASLVGIILIIDIFTKITSATPIWIPIVTAILLVYALTTVWFLIFSKSVKEFLYSQKNG